MGWKLAIVVAPLQGRDLQAAVDDLYGAPQILEPSDRAVREAIHPDGEARYALAHDGLAYVFDWSLVTRALDKPIPVKSRLWTFALHSVVNLYGFSVQEGGAYLRCRSGSADDGIIADFGAPTPLERTLVAAQASPNEEPDAWQAWCDDHATFGGEEEMAHDTLGEEVVLGLLEDLTTFRLDQSSPAATAFNEARVMTLVPTKSKSLLGRLFGP